MIFLQACVPPAPSVYIRNYSSSGVDVITIYHGTIPDSVYRQLQLVKGLSIERSLPYKTAPAVQEKIDTKAFRVHIPSGHSLLLPGLRYIMNGFYDSTTVLLVQDHYLVDTLFHNSQQKYLEKFELAQRLMYVQYFYNHR